MLSRLSIDNVSPIWGIAKSTENEQLAGACLSVMSVDCDRLVTMDVFRRYMAAPDVENLFETPAFRKLKGETQFRTLAKWVDAKEDEDEYYDHLDDLFAKINFTSISPKSRLELLASNESLACYKKCR